MRFVSLENVTDKMTLAKTIYDSRGNVILPKGTAVKPYLKQIENFKIKFLYVDDEISKNIEVWGIISERTRTEIPEAMRRAKTLFKPVDNPMKKTFINLPYLKLAKYITEDVLARSGVHIDVTELQLNRIYPFEHELNVAIISAMIAKLMGLPSTQIQAIALGGLIHDIGRLAIPEDISHRHSGSPLTNAEFDIFKQYPIYGYNMIKNDNALDIMTKVIPLQHMERYDGKGYPYRKNGEMLNIASKIAAIANAFDELMHGRNLDYGRKPMKIYEVVEYIQNHAGTIFDPEIATEFTKHAIVFPNGIMVKLSNGCKGIVINQNINLISRPIVRVTHDEEGLPAIGLINLFEHMSIVIDDIEI